MIKIKIHNPLEGKNKQSFLGFLYMREALRDYSIDITDSDDYDYLFVGANEILNKKISLEESVERGLKFLDGISGDYFIFDGSDSTSLMGAYEVLVQSKAKYLFKNQLLKSREAYAEPTAFNKWFFGNGSDLDLGYNISEEDWSRIKLSGWNLGYFMPNLQFRPATQKLYQPSESKAIDLCAIYQGEHFKESDHLARNDMYYTNHRTGAWKEIAKQDKYSSVKDKLPYDQYINTLYQSKLALSPFGMGEVCYRDFEVLEFGVALVKPDMSRVDTYPNIFIENETYIPVEPDWSNLNEKVLEALANPEKISYIRDNARKAYQEQYTVHNFCMYWYNIFANLDNVTHA